MNGCRRSITAYLALGSNLGNRLACLRGARRALHRPPLIRVVAASPIYETAPVGGPAGQSPYLNAVLRVETLLSAAELLAEALAVEKLFGRRRTERWGPRTLDVDLLLFGDEIHRQADLTIPHPRLHQRAFVLVPLRDLSPGLLHPLLGQTVEEMMARLSSPAGIRCLRDQW
ncbi:2-amino-4-hydroxy-6-hydroxymethyldihydropteridine diphosphokinase [Syntrophotalea acetylenica]|jgi:2-amino-4-hydroxy-6-hydroxymethyldihydropteridine diphosphokinase|uniref:2-amino-4-hydroxy-6- hydroxymethyldihydropteridine diphosphokinase n=1 Tax=Syntrophotalea acetylenica TaxID=29542 RepID=UPI002A361AF8|nr:2-amino-4-hydroxy-6-hydroxymethyldihydropteridine diphosphokinase [Syntrophotalea acetylenica]MDY0262228.1 2-amino-4-hydroxy-6-hydroxymethyldihydropteridine diphosphokinase [Syntrophotalea acetylenica]